MVYIVAEMSANHCGDYHKACNIVKKAAECGADAIKTQLYTPDMMTIDCDSYLFKITSGPWKDRTLYDLYKEAAMPLSWHKLLREYAHNLGLEYIVTPFSEEGVDICVAIGVDKIKIASFEITDIPLIKKIADSKKDVILSTGMASKLEITTALAYLVASKVVLLKCTSAYPAELRDLNLNTIKDMQNRFNRPIGFSDHTEGIIASLGATALGACMIEKHFTLDSNSGSPDDSFSMEPKEFKDMIEKIRQMEKALGYYTYGSTKTEKENMKYRRSIFAVKDIEPDDVLTKENIKIIRPGYGLAPIHYDKILGRKLGCKMKRGEPIGKFLLYKDIPDHNQ